MGADEFSCLSRYDGLLFLRVNPLGAWHMGHADEYRLATPTRVELCQRSGNRFVVVREADLDAVRNLARKIGHVWPIPGV